MNTASFKSYKNNASFEQHENKVEASLIRIESDYAFLNSSQVIDEPKEREQCKDLQSNEATRVSE